VTSKLLHRGATADSERAPGSASERAGERVRSLEGIEVHVASGHPGEELAAFSHELDLLTVGSRGYGPLRRMMLGSTSQQLSRTARCPLLVLPRAPVGTDHVRADRPSAD
jgi:nucleotide-binding universal stress UspA family protein